MTKLGPNTNGAEGGEPAKYERPQLTELGSLLDLTAEGVGEADDSDGSGSQ